MQIGPAAGAAPLLEREAELRALEDALAAARSGTGGLTLVAGAAGAGKSRLLHEAAALAAGTGMDVLRATGDEYERDFPFGVALQLFEARLWRAQPAEREELLSGAAGVSKWLFEPDVTAPPSHGPDEVLRLVHGLFWVVQNLAEQRPLAVLVDDAQWADAPSLQLVRYLAPRIGDLPVAVVAASRTGAEEAESPLAADPVGRVLALGPLSANAVTTFVQDRLPEATAAFCEACAEATRGNPFFLEELLRTVATEGVPTSDEGAEQVRELVPDAVSRSILLRLSRLPAEAASLAQAVAVLGEASVADAAALARVDPTRAGPLADALTAAGVLAERERLAYPHPIVRATVYDDTPRAERGRMQLRAAQLLLAAGAPAERVSAHLLATPPAREAWVVEPLRHAAAHALATGAAASAVRYLRRALAELPPTAEIFVELGTAEAAAAEPEAPDHLEAALRLLEEPLSRARVRLLLGRALSAQGRFSEAARAFADGEVDARGRDADLLIELEAGYLGVARFEPTLQGPAAERIERLIRQPPAEDAPAQRPVLADVALARAWAGAPAAEVMPLVERAWAGGALLAEQGPDAHSIYILTGAILAVDELELELEVLGATLREARRRGSVMALATASYCRSIPLYYLARIPDALADAELAVQTERDGWEMFLPTARAFLALARLERGDVDGAERALELRDPERWRESLTYVPYLDAQARVLLAQRRPAEALATALELGRLLEETYGGIGRGYLQWRVTAAFAAVATGDRKHAARLCDDELEIARAGDRAREIGATLRTRATLEEGERRIELLHEAVETLERSQSTLELLRALVDYGGALRRAGRRQEAREPLLRALDLASARGATALAERARQELLASGARPRRTALGGVEALTPSELRVARLAADGLRNREIAEALFVSGKTVDYHLHHVYQKLDVTRPGLAEALAAKP
jgi:DNA-binding CsgD family transcriptional regulator/ketosteroid isomerase-like protein